MVRSLTLIMAGVAVLLSAPALAQASGEVILYKSGNFRGPRYTITGPTQQIEVPFTVKSVQIPAGEEWEFCTGSTYSGCRRVSQSDPSILMTVRSARPAGPAAAAAIAAEVVATGTGIRGVASEYFISPEEGGERIAVHPGTEPARADEFCRARGWGSSAYQGLQRVGAAAYLADVLCVQGGS